MRIVSWSGSLGNQISSYIFYRWLEIKTGDECIYDVLPYNYILFRDLYIFDLYTLFPNAKKSRSLNQVYPGAETEIVEHIKKQGNREIVPILKKHFGNEVSLVKPYHNFSKIAGLDKFFKQIYYLTSCFDFSPGVATLKGDIHYNTILYLNRGWYDEIKTNLRNEFGFSVIKNSEKNSEKNIRLLKTINNTEAVALHFRIFENTSFYSIDSIKSIRDSITFIKERVSNAVFYVFSNYPEIFEKEYAHSLFNGKDDFIIVKGNDNETYYRDFQLCSNCRHFILTNNSSFGYYAALLGKWKEKIICQNANSLSKL